MNTLHPPRSVAAPAHRCAKTAARSAALVAALLGCAAPSPAPPTNQVTAVTVVHFSDYHSHSVPYFSEHQPDQGGIARTVGYLKALRARDTPALILSGGDMINAGTPAWSDKYRCAEWAWLNGLVDAMAFGNHDVDYGWDAFAGCQRSATFPVLSANLVDGQGARLLQSDGKPYVVKELGGVRIGVFALSGPDFPSLVKAQNLPTGAKFTDPLVAAAAVVKALREQEHVAAVIFLGHQDRESDFKMAAAVPGIDLILGTHSHYKGAFQQIPGTSTRFISPTST